MKPPQADLYPDAVPGTALRLGGKGGKGTARLSPVQQRFNRLMAKIDKLKSQVAEIQTLTNVYRPLYQSTLEPLREQQKGMTRRMALWLDERLERKGLTPAQKRNAIEILCGLCVTLAAGGDEAMAALHDKRSPLSLREVEEGHAAEMRASQEHLQQAMQAEQDQRKAVKARKKKKSTAAQRKAGQQQEDAETILRQLYRRLVSALHPDRERDPAEHQRKTALMSEVNAAYGRQDLVALLHLQLRTAQADTQDLLQQPEERIAAMSHLLKQQAAELENELFARQEHLGEELGLEFYQTPTAAMLRSQLAMQEEDLKDELSLMEWDLEMVQTDAGLKRWMKMQARMSQDIDYF